MQEFWNNYNHYGITQILPYSSGTCAGITALKIDGNETATNGHYSLVQHTHDQAMLYTALSSAKAQKP